MPTQQESERTQRIIEHLKETWSRSRPAWPDDLEGMTTFVLSLPEQYRQVGLAKIAEYTVNAMSMHILNLMTIFQQNAEQEGIRIENVKKTFDHIYPEAFQTLSNLSKNIQVQSLEDITALTNITVNLQILSLSDTAEDAQSWLYELPSMYYQQLSQERLIGNKQIRILPMETRQSQKSVDWMSQTTKGYVHPGIENSQVPFEKTGAA